MRMEVGRKHVTVKMSESGCLFLMGLCNSLTFCLVLYQQDQYQVFLNFLLVLLKFLERPFHMRPTSKRCPPAVVRCDRGTVKYHSAAFRLLEHGCRELLSKNYSVANAR